MNLVSYDNSTTSGIADTYMALKEAGSATAQRKNCNADSKIFSSSLLSKYLLSMQKLHRRNNR